MQVSPDKKPDENSDICEQSEEWRILENDLAWRIAPMNDARDVTDAPERPGDERAVVAVVQEADAVVHERTVMVHTQDTDVAPGGSVRGERANFTGLVLLCIEAKFCNKICVGKLSPRSTQCTPLHRSLISKISLKIAEFFAVFSKISRIISLPQNFAEFSPNFTNFFRDFSKMQHFSKKL